MAGSWVRRVARYVVSAGLVTLMTVSVGWPWLDAAGRRALVLAIGVAFAVQVATFAVLASFKAGTVAYLATWVGSTLVRLGVVGGVAFVVAAMDDVDLVVALVVLVGLLFVLLLLEPWALREPQNGGVNE